MSNKINSEKPVSPAEIGSLTDEAAGAEGVFQVGVDLHLLRELDSLDLDESCGYCFHVGLGVAEGYTATSDWVPDISMNISSGHH